MYRLWIASVVLAVISLVAADNSSAQSATNPPTQPSTKPSTKLPTKPQGLFAHQNVEQGWSLAVARKKPLLVMFTSDNCVYCKKMIKETYRHPAIEKMLVSNTESVLAHANDYQALVKKLGIRGYPSSILIGPDGQVLDFMEGYVEPKAFAKRVYPLLHKRTAQVASRESKGPSKHKER